MAQHSRPLPSPRTPGQVVPESSLPPLPPRPSDDPPPHEHAPQAAERALDTRAPAPPYLDDAGERAAGPWYRTEPWLVVELAAALPIVGALLAPPAYRAPLIGLGALLVVVGLAMLVRHERRSAPRRRT